MSQINQNQFPSTTQSFIEVDCIQMNFYLEVLGYKRGNAIYIGAFLLKAEPHYGQNTACKAKDRIAAKLGRVV